MLPVLLLDRAAAGYTQGTAPNGSGTGGWNVTTISGGTPRADHPDEPVPEYDRPPFLHRRGLLSVLVRGTVMLLALAATVAFAVALARVTLLPSPASRSMVHANLRPGASSGPTWTSRPSARRCSNWAATCCSAPRSDCCCPRCSRRPVVCSGSPD